MSEVFKLRTVLAASGRWPRRKLRRSRDVAFFEDRSIALDDTIPLGPEWTSFTFRGDRMRARVGAPACCVLNKPVGAVTSRRSDTEDPTVFDALPANIAARVEPVGRLDRDTHGVLLFTEDGQLLHRLTHPRRKVLRVYRVHTREQVSDAEAEALRSGHITLADGHVPKPSFVKAAGAATSWIVGLTEGKYHEVRRMFAAVGALVVELQRVAYADIGLDGLAAAESRAITGEELVQLYEIVGLPAPGAVLHVEVLSGES